LLETKTPKFTLFYTLIEFFFRCCPFSIRSVVYHQRAGAPEHGVM
jgi:hypothetical protein